MVRFALALSLAALIVLPAPLALAQQAAPAAPAAATAASGTNCKKVYVQKKSARTGQYVHVARQRCA